MQAHYSRNSFLRMLSCILSETNQSLTFAPNVSGVPTWSERSALNRSSNHHFLNLGNGLGRV